MVALIRLGCADRDAVGLKPSKDRTANVLSWPLELCGCGSIDSARQLSRAEHREPRSVFGSHGHGRYLTDWLSVSNDFVLVRTLIRGEDAVLQSAERRCDLDQHQKGRKM